MVLTELGIEGWTGAAVLAAKSGGGGVERRRSGDQIDAGASGGRGSESGGDPGPKAKLQRRISVAEVRRGFGTTAARGVQGLCSGRSNLEAAAGVWAALRGGMAGAEGRGCQLMEPRVSRRAGLARGSLGISDGDRGGALRARGERN